MIRRATTADLPALLRLAEQARQIMRQSGNMNQWVNGYPTEDAFLNDIHQQGSFVVERDGAAVATFACLPSPEPTYAHIDGAWLNEADPYIVIHRIASTPDCHGIFSEMLEYCDRVCPNIRIDTHRDNVIMRHLLSRHGFTYCGIIYLANGDERLAFQRIR